MFALTGCMYAVVNGYVPNPVSMMIHNEVVNEAHVTNLRVGDNVLNVEIAQTNYERVRGLSGRASLPEYTGLLFIFPRSDFQSIWMKDMLFSIDIVWLDSTLTVVDIKENALPESYPEIFTSVLPAKYVLEISAGDAKKWGIEKGMKLETGAPTNSSQ